MLAEGRFRTEGALQAANDRLIRRLDRKSKTLRRSALAGFLFFSASLGVRWGTWPASWDPRQLPRPWPRRLSPGRAHARWGSSPNDRACSDRVGVKACGGLGPLRPVVNGGVGEDQELHEPALLRG